MTASRTTPPTALRPEAVTRESLSLAAGALSERWQLAARGHLDFGAGCGCGIGATIDLRDLDEFILDYLRNRFAGAPEVVRSIDRLAGITSTRRPGLRALLRAIAAGRDDLTTAQVHELLRETEASIASIEEQHAPPTLRGQSQDCKA